MQVASWIILGFVFCTSWPASAQSTVSTEDVRGLVSGKAAIWTADGGAALELFFDPSGEGEARVESDKSGSLKWDISLAPGSLCFTYRLPDASTPSSCGWVKPSADGFDLDDENGKRLGRMRIEGAYGTVSLTIGDIVGADGPGAFTLSDEAGHVIARGKASVDPIRVTAGAYIVEPEVDALATVPIMIKPGETAAARYDRQDTLWVPVNAHLFDPATQQDQAKVIKALGLLRPQSERVALLRARRNPPLVQPFGRTEPRDGAASADIAAALRLARQWFDAGGTPPAVIQTGGFYAERLASAILMHFGDDADVARLLDNALESKTTQSPYATDAPDAAAFLEERLGKIRNGRLAAMAEGSDARKALLAMAALSGYGDPRWSSRLVPWVMSPPEASDAGALSRLALAALRSAPLDQVLPLMGPYQERFRAEQQKIAAEPAGPNGSRRLNPWDRFEALDYLYASSATSDLKKVASESLNIFLAAMFRNPQDLFYPRSAKYLEADEGTYVCGVLEAFPPASAAGLLDEMRARFIARGGLSQYFDVFTSACHPTAKMAELYGGGVDQYGKHGQAWAPEPWLEDDVLKQLREGSLSWFLYSQLDYLPQDRIATALAGDAPFDAKDLFLAFHKVLRVGTAQNSFAIRYAARQTRPFAVILPNEWDGLGGALSGLLSVAIARDGQKAAIRATVDARPYYRGYCELATKIRNDCNLDAWLVRKFAVDPGKLIRRLEVRRAGVEVPVQETPGRSPGRAFSVALGPEGWKDTYLFVELALEAPATSVAAGGAPPPVPVITREFSFALFDTPEARAETWEAPR